MAALVGALVVGSCGSADESGEPSAGVVVSSTVWADVVANVACDDDPFIHSLIPAGGDAHGFEPSLADRGRIDDAALVVVTGVGEEQLDDTVDAAAADGATVIRISDHVAAASPLADDADPHLWLDPVLVSGVVPVLADALVAELGLDADAVAACMQDYQAQLEDLRAAVAEQLGSVAPDRRQLVTDHRSMTYFASRFGFDVAGTVVASGSSLGDTSTAHLQELVEVIETSGVGAIFVAQGSSADEAQAVAEQAGGVDVVEVRIESLGPPGSGAETYAGLMRTLADTIAQGLG